MAGMRWIAILALMAAPVAAQTTDPVAPVPAVCPAAPDHAAEQAAVIAALKRTPNAQQAFPLSQRLWEMWTDAPDAKAQALLDDGMARREGYDFLGARDTFDTLVEYCPDYAEGYNQRAFASFLRQDYAAALYDLDKALTLNPEHIAALSGKGLTLMGLGRTDEAQEVLRAAVALNPWLKERSLISEPEGTDL